MECLTGDSGRDAVTNRFLETCDIDESVPLARAEPNGVVVTGDVDGVAALAAHAPGVAVERA